MASLANIFKKKRPPLVGIDISASSVKVLELSRSGNQYRVERFAAEPVPQNAIVEHAITEVEQVAEVVQRAIKRSGTKLKNAAVAVASTHVITKLIKIPKGLGEHELNTQAEMEAEHYIPYPLDEVNLDYQVIPSGEEDSEEDDLLMAACRKEIIDDYVSVLEDAGHHRHRDLCDGKRLFTDYRTYAGGWSRKDNRRAGHRLDDDQYQRAP